MQSKLNFDHQTQSVAMATGAAAIAAIAAMFVPAGIWETLTGATGVSEMIPATGAPLGDKARALISFTFGALTLVILTVMFLRRGNTPMRTALAQSEAEADMVEPEVGPAFAAFETDNEPETEAEMVDTEEVVRGSLLSRLRARITDFAEARRGADDITDLEDLPKLRSGDAHPDAPPRRPFSANRDIAEVEAMEVFSAAPGTHVEAEWVEPATVEMEEFVEVVEVEPIINESTTAVAEDAIDPAVSATPASDFASLDDMVSRFELALAERDAQLAHIENIAGELRASNVQPIRPDIETPSAYEPAPIEQAPLRAVEIVEAEPSDVPQRPESEELDAALRSALETLHRMNARTR